jgi:hypothetical protein
MTAGPSTANMIFSSNLADVRRGAVGTLRARVGPREGVNLR